MTLPSELLRPITEKESFSSEPLDNIRADEYNIGDGIRRKLESLKYFSAAKKPKNARIKSEKYIKHEVAHDADQVEADDEIPT